MATRGRPPGSKNRTVAAHQEPTTIEARADDTRRERRKKPGSLLRSGKLAFDESTIDRKEFEPRWVRDVSGRVAELEAQDYDIVRDKSAKTDTLGGSIPSAIGGTDDKGEPYRMVLMKKRRDWYEADREEKLAPARETMAQIRGGKPLASNADFDKAHYTPEGSINIQTEDGFKKDT